MIKLVFFRCSLWIARKYL